MAEDRGAGRPTGDAGLSLDRLQLGLVSAAGWTLAIRLTGVALQLALFVLIVRFHSVREVGLYAVAFNVWAIVRQLGPLGLDSAALRLIPPLLLEDRARVADALERWSRWRLLMFAVPFASACAVGGTLLAAGGRVVGMPPVAVLTIVATGVVYAFNGLSTAQLRARYRVVAAQIPESLFLPLGVIGFVLAGSAVGNSTLEWVLVGHLVSAIGVAAAYQALGATGRLRTREQLPAEIASSAAKTASKILAADSLTTLSIRIPVVLVSVVLSSSSAAQFESAQRAQFVGETATWAVGVAVSPLFSSTHARGPVERLQELLSLASWLSLIPALGVVGVLAVVGPGYLSVLGSGYAQAYAPMLLLSLAAAVNASAGLAGTLFYMTGHERVVVWFGVARLAAVLVGVPCGAKWFGLPGVAAAILGATVIRDGGLSLFLARELHMAPGIWSRTGLQATISGTRRILVAHRSRRR